jgi:glucosamine-6-phosphate deaminase
MNKIKISIMSTTQIARYVTASLSEQLKVKPNAVLGMTTGNTPLTTGIYKEWVRAENDGELSFAESIWINPDEQIDIAPDHTESYNHYMKHHILDALKRQPNQWHIPIGITGDPDAECRKLQKTIESCGGVDWQLMGLGLNGHICFIEPAESLPAQCYITPIAEESRRLYAVSYGSLEAVPTRAITYGIGTALDCRKIKMVVSGVGKADIVARALTSPVSTRLPATFLQLHPDTEFILDSAAASKLPANLADHYEIIRYDEAGDTL